MVNSILLDTLLTCLNYIFKNNNYLANHHLNYFCLSNCFLDIYHKNCLRNALANYSNANAIMKLITLLSPGSIAMFESFICIINILLG